MINSILYIVGAVIELSNILLCYSQILQADISKKRQKIYWAYAVIVLFNVINIFCKLEIHPTLINMLCCLFAPILVMDNKKCKWILLYPCAYVISSIISVAVSFLMAVILKVPQVEVANNIVMALIANSFFTVLMLILSLMKKLRGKKEKIRLFFSNSIYIAMTIGATIFYLLIGLIQYIGSLYKIPDIQINLLGFFLSFVCILFFVFFFWLSVAINKNETFLNEKNMLSFYLSEQEKYIQLILEKDKEIRKFRHDVKEHVYIISQCIEQEDYKEAKKYIAKMSESFSNAQIKRYTGIVAIDAIISEKKNCMDRKGIEFICQMNLMRLPKYVAVYDVCTLFINILNNAIEACEYLKPVDKVIRLVVEVEGDRLYIFEKNKYINNIEFDNNKNPMSTKKDDKNHGLGSKNVRSVVEKYDGEVKYSVDNDNFIVEIIV